MFLCSHSSISSLLFFDPVFIFCLISSSSSICSLLFPSETLQALIPFPNLLLFTSLPFYQQRSGIKTWEDINLFWKSRRKTKVAGVFDPSSAESRCSLPLWWSSSRDDMWDSANLTFLPKRKFLLPLVKVQVIRQVQSQHCLLSLTHLWVFFCLQVILPAWLPPPPLLGLLSALFVCLFAGLVFSVVFGWWTESCLCLLDLTPADVSCLIVLKLNRSSSHGPAGACSPHDFPSSSVTLNHSARYLISAAGEFCSTQSVICVLVSALRTDNEGF